MSIETSPTLVSAIVLVVGLILLGSGYRIARLSMGLAGLLLGGYLGHRLGTALGASGWMLIGHAAGGALLLAMLMPLVRKLGLFLLGFGVGAGLATLVVGPPDGTTAVAITAGAGVISGIAGMFLEQPLLAVATSYIGAVAAVVGFFGLTGLDPDPELLTWAGPPQALPWTFTLPVLVLWVIGSVHQLSWSRRRRREQHDED